MSEEEQKKQEERPSSFMRMNTAADPSKAHDIKRFNYKSGEFETDDFAVADQLAVHFVMDGWVNEIVLILSGSLF